MIDFRAPGACLAAVAALLVAATPASAGRVHIAAPGTLQLAEAVSGESPANLIRIDSDGLGLNSAVNLEAAAGTVPAPIVHLPVQVADSGGTSAADVPETKAEKLADEAEELLLNFGAGPDSTPPMLEGLGGWIGSESDMLLAELDASSVGDVFTKLGYRLDAVRGGEPVPRLVSANFPTDMRHIRSIGERKRLFIKTLLPAILLVNETVAEQRARLVALHARVRSGSPLEPQERQWLSDLATTYEAADGDFATLMSRVDMVPPSLALAQAIEESGWGTSRFAASHNSLFGQMAGKSGLKSFPWLLDSVAAYVQNLNTHPAYAGFRETRAKRRARGMPLDGHQLAGTLTSYSERRGAYIATVRALMRMNSLDVFDQARLQDGGRVVRLVGPNI